LLENLQVLQYIGKTKTEKLLMEIGTEYQELFRKRFPNYQENYPSQALSIVSILEKGEIKQIGMSCVNDLILENFGKFLRNLWSGSTSLFNMIDNAGVSRGNLSVFGNNDNTLLNLLGNGSGQTLGSLGQIGSGIATAQRTDFKIQTPIGVGDVSTTNGGYNSGLGRVTVSFQFGLSGSGNIAEAGLFGRWYSQDGTNERTFMIAHDNISPIVPFVDGETANVDYQWNMS